MLALGQVWLCLRVATLMPPRDLCSLPVTCGWIPGLWAFPVGPCSLGSALGSFVPVTHCGWPLGTCSWLHWGRVFRQGSLGTCSAPVVPWVGPGLVLPTKGPASSISPVLPGDTYSRLSHKSPSRGMQLTAMWRAAGSVGKTSHTSLTSPTVGREPSSSLSALLGAETNRRTKNLGLWANQKLLPACAMLAHLHVFWLPMMSWAGESVGGLSQHLVYIFPKSQALWMDNTSHNASIVTWLLLCTVLHHRRSSPAQGTWTTSSIRQEAPEKGTCNLMLKWLKDKFGFSSTKKKVFDSYQISLKQWMQNQKFF